MMRVMLFLLVNLSVMVVLGVIFGMVGFFSLDSFKLIGIFGLIGLGGSLVSLFLSKTLALMAVNGIIIKNASNDIENWLLKIIRDQSYNLNIAIPQLAIYESDDMNAFATGARRNASLIAVSSGLLKNMSRDSIEAVIAHEMSHIVSGDMVTMTLIQGVLNTFIIFIARKIAQLILYSSNLLGVLYINDICHDNNSNCHDSYYDVDHSLIYVVISVILEFLFGIIASVIVFWFSRNREFYADAGSAILVGCDKMINALQELKNSCVCAIIPTSIVHLCIHHVGNNNVFENLFTSHPSLDKRIDALKRGTYLNKSTCFFKKRN